MWVCVYVCVVVLVCRCVASCADLATLMTHHTRAIDMDTYDERVLKVAPDQVMCFAAPPQRTTLC